MTFQTNYPTAPRQDAGFRIFARSAYPAKYNFAVDNYNYVCSIHKLNMRGGHLFLFRSVVTIVWAISLLFAFLSLFKSIFMVVTVICSLFYIVFSIYNSYVFFRNRDLLNATRLLAAKVPALNGADHEWVSIPLKSGHINSRLADIDQSSFIRLQEEYLGGNQPEVPCMIYTKTYAETYPTFPKELLLHCFAFLLTTIFACIMAAL
ncbi:unnamed protein product [Adineta ricciae]|uniref:Uncharacterized protein n=1 Tax=Adineta ricciae TaxID=249248 RepID=A0A814XTJ1_ADIRI|nr:unnamed protein product [Adineta ricciae]